MDGPIRIQVSGDLNGNFVVIEALSEDEFVIVRDSSLHSLTAIRERSRARPATAQEFTSFEYEHGPFHPPDGEG